MKRGGGNRKGASFERFMCKTFSRWLTAGKRVDIFWRTAMSGGRATVMARRGVDIRQGGDMCSQDPDGHVLTDYLYFEFKHLKKIPVESLLMRRGLLHKVWAKAQRESLRAGKNLVLVMRQNGSPITVLADGGAARYLRIKARMTVHEYDMHVCLLKDLLASPPPRRRVRLIMRQS